MCKDITPRADFQADNMLFTLDPIKNKDVLVDFSAPNLSSLRGLTLVNEYIRHRSNNIIDRIRFQYPRHTQSRFFYFE